MSRIDNRNAVVRVPGPQVIDNFRLCSAVERRERFVQEQHGRIDNERAGQRRPLALAAGDLAGLVPGQMCNLKRFENFCRSLPPRRPIHVGQSVLHVLFDGQMRKQRQILEQVADLALAHRYVNAQRGIEQHPPSCSQGYPPRMGADQSRDAVQDRRLARARCAKQDGEPGRRQEFHVHAKGLGLLHKDADRKSR